MTGTADNHVQDAAAEAIAAIAVGDYPSCSVRMIEATKAVLFDSISVALTALPHRASIAARQYGRRFKRNTGACTIWGESYKTDLETAALINGVLMRCHDFNDLYVGTRSAGHPSDIVVGVMAAAEQLQSTGREVLLAIAVGYEVMLTLFDLLPVEDRGFDYTNVSMIGATCSIGRLMGLPFEQMKQALCISATAHLSTNEIESGDLNGRGDLTLWKRFHGGEAVRQACLSCQLASMDIEGASRAFTGAAGFLTHMGAESDIAAELQDRLRPGRELSRVCDSTMKRWPVGSRAQSAIHAALEARRQIVDLRAIASVHVITNESTFDHLVRIRPHARRPFSRETADHSLSYIVGAALLDGRIGPDSFDPDVVNDPDRLDFLKNIEIAVEAASALSGKEQADRGYPTKIILRTENGREISANGGRPPGHVSNRLSRTDLEDKLAEGLAFSGLADRSSMLSDALWSIAASRGVTALTALLGTGDAHLG